MSRKEKKVDRDLYLDSLIKDLQAELQRERETGEALYTDTEIYIYKGPLPPERFGKD